MAAQPDQDTRPLARAVGLARSPGASSHGRIETSAPGRGPARSGMGSKAVRRPRARHPAACVRPRRPTA